MPSLAVKSNSRNVAVDVLRGLAALAVVALHIPHPPVKPPYGWREWAWLPVEFGGLGVTLFIVLSGYCIHARAARRLARGNSDLVEWGPFWRRRFLRLYPPYLAAALLGILLCGGLAHWPWDALTHAFMVHNLTRDYVFGLHNPALWSLGLEFQLYALYAVVIALRRRWRLSHVVGFVLAINLVWSIGRSVVHRWIAARWGVPPLEQTIDFGPIRLGCTECWPFAFWFAWLLGAVAVEAETGAVRLPRWMASRRALVFFTVAGLGTHKKILGAAGIATMPPAIRELAYALLGLSEPALALAFFVWLNRWLQAEKWGRFNGRWIKPLAAVGAISYSLYLVHLPLIHGWLEPLLSWPYDQRWAIFGRYLVEPTMCLIVAAIFYLLIEKPCLRLLHGKTVVTPAAQRRAA